MTTATQIEGFQLSPQQRDLWRFAQRAGTGTARGVLHLEGPLDPARLRRALETLVARHAALRTTFHRLPWITVPVQTIDQPRLRFDRQPAGRGGRRDAVEGLLDAAVAADLEAGPVARFALVSADRDRHLLLLDLPALCADAWSLARLAEEIPAAYAGRQPPAAEEERLEYVQYAAWQNDLLEDGEEAAAGRARWQRLLASPPALDDAVRGAAPAACLPHCFARRLDRRLADGLAHLAECFRVDLEAVVLACWQLLLWRLGGPSPVVVRERFDGRKLEELEAVLGPMAKDLPVAVDLVAGMRLGELVAETAAARATADEGHELFTEAEAESAEGAPPWPCHPLLFAGQRMPPAVAAGGLRWTLAALDVRSQPYDLALIVTIAADGDLVLAWQHQPARFDALAAQRMAKRLEATLAAAVAGPEARIEALPVIGGAERHQLLRAWSRPPAATARAALPVHLRIAAAARRWPQRPAVIAAGVTLSFAQLRQRVEQLVARLRGEGVGPEVPVAIFLDRSVELVVALLAVLESGGAYLPLDPWQPVSRLRAMLEDARVPLVLSRSSLCQRLPAGGPPVWVLDGPLPEPAAASSPAAAIEAESLAYMIYTSGSTGRPKGVLIRHGALGHLADALEARLDPAAVSRVGLNAPIAFDASVKQWLHLANGRTLAIVPEEARADGAALLRFMEDQRLDLMDATPVQVRILLEAGLGASPAAGTRLLIGGEAIDPALWARLRELPAAWNVYGPTECTVDATVARIGPRQPVPVIGRPLGGVTVQVLDARQRTVPAGAAGELVIGGRGVARGYLRRPALTALSFVPDPLGEAGARRYRSGDLVRFGADGQLVYLGRIDAQIKVRGIRIEPGEIEAALVRHAEVREAAVDLERPAGGDPRLVAWVVARGARPPSPAALREHVREHLPESMSPAVFVALDALPLSPNGKLDRRALPAPDSAEVLRDEAFTPPRTPVEELLAGVWQTLLGVERVGVEQSFFELGGHSLVATQLVSHVRRVLAVELPLRDIFAAPRLLDMARAVEVLMGRTEARVAPPIEPVPRDRALPLSFAQERLWFLDQLEPGTPYFNAPGALQLTGVLDVLALRRTVNAIVRRHEALRTVYPSREGQALQVIQPWSPVAIPLVDLSALPPAHGIRERDRWVRREIRRPFDLARGPLLRVRLLRTEARAHALLLTRHHIVSDAWSTDVLVHELQGLYAGSVAGRPATLPPLPVQYADFAVWQRQWLRGSVLREHLAYWKRHLAGELPVLELAADRPRPALPSYRGGRLDFSLPDALSERLAAVSREEGVTAFMSLLAVFDALLQRLSGQDDVITGVSIANRNRSEIEGLIGFFINMLAIRVDLGGDPSFRSLLARVRTVVLDGLAHQDLPYATLVEHMKLPRQLGVSALFKVVFNFYSTKTRDQSGTVALGDDLELAPLPMEHDVVRWDLMLTIAEHGGRMWGSWSYNRDLFEAATVERFSRSFETLLASAMAAPASPLSELEMVSAAQRSAQAAEDADRARARRRRLRRVKPKAVEV